MMKFYVDGEAVRESTGQTDEEAARRVLVRRREELRRGDSVAHEERLTLADLRSLIRENYELRGNTSKDTMLSTFKHVERFFGERCKAIRIGPRIEKYVAHRKAEGAAVASIRAELSFLDRAFRLAVQKKRLSHRARPYIEKPPTDPTSVRRGFFAREEVERLCAPCDCSEEAIKARFWSARKRAQTPDIEACCHLPQVIADVVLFLFFCPWRVGAARRIEWRDYSEADEALTLRPELNKTGYELQIPVDAENTPELMAITERQKARRRPDCPFIFHGEGCGMARFDKKGRRRPCLGDFQDVWDLRCGAIGMAGRIPHDLRRSGVKHYIGAGVDPHTVMQWSGHRTEAMLRRYHIIDLDDLRRAGRKASDYRGPKPVVTPLRSTSTSGQRRTTRTGTERAQEVVQAARS
jgi:integrase